MSHSCAPKVNPFAEAAFGDPQRHRRDKVLEYAVVTFVVRYTTEVLRDGIVATLSRAKYRDFWCDVAELAVSRSDGIFEEKAEELLIKLRVTFDRQRCCNTLHQAFFRLLLTQCVWQLEPYLDTFCVGISGFYLPNDARAVAAALKPLSTLVSLASGGDGKGARVAMAGHLRQLHHRAFSEPSPLSAPPSTSVG